MKQLDKLLCVGSGLALLTVIVANLFDIVTGTIWGRPLSEVYDIVKVAMGFAVFLALPSVFLSDSNIRVEIIDMFVGPKIVTTLRVLGLVSSLIFLVVLLVATIGPAEDAWKFNDRFHETGISHLAVWSPVIVGTITSAVWVVVLIVKLIGRSSNEAADT